MAQPCVFFASLLTAYHFSYPPQHLNSLETELYLLRQIPSTQSPQQPATPKSILKFIPLKFHSKSWDLRLNGKKKKNYTTSKSYYEDRGFHSIGCYPVLGNSFTLP